ncbi:MAG: DUF982 domain-containing protein [Rhizobiaceae bacterium]|nr:DUF982 domain-containing protein [Rhizobiaceae bacterium]
MSSKVSGIFHRPVVVQPGRIDRDRVVVSAADAARVLAREWRGDSAKRQRAIAACLDVVSGRKPPRHARSAFIDAARDARILIE